MMRKLYIPLLYLFICLFFGCYKDGPVPLQPYPKDCPDNGYDSIPTFHKNEIRLDPMFYYDSLYVRFPYFNPNNPDEIIYYLAYKQELIKQNIATKSKQLLYKGLLFNAPKWSRKGWILLPTGGAQIWKIKDDGTQLTQLTFGAIGHYAPEWNWDGTKFGCQANNRGHGYGLVYNEFGVALDSSKYALTSCWQCKNNMLIGAYDDEVRILDVLKDTMILIYRFPSNTTQIYGGCYWMPDGINAILGGNNGVYSLNTQTKKLTFLKQNCPHDFYNSVCVSFISNKILLAKSSYNYVGHNSFFIQNKIIIMNTDGSGEVDIEL